MIVCNGAQFIYQCLNHIYDYADEIIICEGAVDHFQQIIGSNFSTDNTMELINQFKTERDKQGKKIRVYSSRELLRPWRDKIEMQNCIGDKVTGQMFVKQDVDEFYDLDGLDGELKRLDDSDKIMINYRSHHFWGDFDHVIVGANFNDKQTRVWKWKRTFKHIKSFNYVTDIQTGEAMAPNPQRALTSEDALFHYSYIYENKIRSAVLKYYHDRVKSIGGGDHQDVKQAWDQQSPHLLRDGRKVVEFKGEHPVSEKVLDSFTRED